MSVKGSIVTIHPEKGCVKGGISFSVIKTWLRQYPRTDVCVLESFTAAKTTVINGWSSTELKFPAN